MDLKQQKYEQLGKHLPSPTEQIFFSESAPKLPNYLDNILKQIASKFLELRKLEIKNSIAEASSIQKGDLIHGVRNLESIENILNFGVISGEVKFDSDEELTESGTQTHYHADFWVNTNKDGSITDYLDWTKTDIGEYRREKNYLPNQNNAKIALIFDPKNPILEDYL